MKPLKLEYIIPGDDFGRAGEASSKLKNVLKRVGYDPDCIRRVAIAMYEGEINTIIHGGGGTAFVEILPNQIEIRLVDEGPGIEDVEKAMQEGYSTASSDIRSLGFGAGMGLPNIKKYTDMMKIDTKVGDGTTLYMLIKQCES